MLVCTLGVLVVSLLVLMLVLMLMLRVAVVGEKLGRVAIAAAVVCPQDGARRVWRRALRGGDGTLRGS